MRLTKTGTHALRAGRVASLPACAVSVMLLSKSNKDIWQKIAISNLLIVYGFYFLWSAFIGDSVAKFFVASLLIVIGIYRGKPVLSALSANMSHMYICLFIILAQVSGLIYGKWYELGKGAMLLISISVFISTGLIGKYLSKQKAYRSIVL